jgi:hypothetical protein
MPGLSPAGAVFSATTANQADSFTANPYWSCADAAAGSGAPGYLALQETTGPTAANGGWAGSSVAHVRVYQVALPADEVLRQLQAVGGAHAVRPWR